MVVADPSLLELPIEGVDLICKAPFGAIGRDFSIELLWHRFKDETTLEGSNADEDGAKKKSQKLPSRVAALREIAGRKAPAQGGGKGGQNFVVARQLPTVGCLPVDTHGFRYFVDVGQDFWPEEDESPNAVFQTLFEKYGSSFMPRWVGVTGQDHTPG